MTSHPLFLIVVLDGMRRDMVTAELMPNLAAFRAAGSDFVKSRSVFPSETRVNSAALGSGCMPDRHGVIANQFFDPRLYADRLFHTGQFEDITRAETVFNGRFITAPSLGEAVAAAGLSMAVVGSGSAGTTRLVNPRAPQLGHVSLCLREWAASTPHAVADEVLAAFGPIPPAGRPNSARTRLQTRIFLEHVFPRFRPDVSVLWYTDPDSTFHYKGIGSPEARQALRDLDDQIGILLDWRRTAGLGDHLQILMLSDHGQIVAREKVPVREALHGLKIDQTFLNGADYVLSSGYSGAVWVSDKAPRLTAAMVEALNAQPWIGSVWTGADGSAVPGTFSRDVARVRHARAPDIYFVMATDDGLDGDGVAGGCFFDDAVPQGGGVHGGLHIHEINNVLMAGGSLFRSGYVSPWPSGIIDVAPTVLDLLGIRGKTAMDGRPLTEAYMAGCVEPPPPRETIQAVHRGGRRHAVATWEVNGARYLARQWVE